MSEQDDRTVVLLPSGRNIRLPFRLPDARCFYPTNDPHRVEFVWLRVVDRSTLNQRIRAAIEHYVPHGRAWYYRHWPRRWQAEY